LNNTSSVNSLSNYESVSVILPSFNERENIEEAVDRISDALGDQLLEIIIIDDDSPDETWKLVKELNREKVSLIHRKEEKGLASALAAGVEKSTGEFVVWLDCDLGIPPEEIINLIQQLNFYDVAIGSRYVKNGSDSRAKWITFSSRLINLLAQTMLSKEVKDYTSGFIALKRKVADHIKINPQGFGEYFIEFVYRCLQEKYKIIEIGYAYGDRKGGVSKSTNNFLVFIKLGVDYLKKIVLLTFKNKL
jgi:dolichol-phosphate mannosyltransferase